MKNFFENIGKTEIRNTLAVVFVTGCLGFIYLLVFHPVPKENRDLINVLGGTVLTGLGLVLSFFYGDKKENNTPGK